MKSSIADLQRNYKKNTSKSLTNIANTVWILLTYGYGNTVNIVKQ